QHGPRPELLVVRPRRGQTGAAVGADADRAPARGVQPVRPRELHGAERQPELRRLRHDYVDVRSTPAPAGSKAALVTAPLLVARVPGAAYDVAGDPAQVAGGFVPGGRGQAAARTTL